MNRRDFIKAVSALPLFFTLKPKKARAAIAPGNMFMMGWDGVGHGKLTMMMSQGRLPNLQAFLDNGAILQPLDAGQQTCTAPNWTMIFTGLHHNATGVTGNQFRDASSYNPTWNSKYQIFDAYTGWTSEVPYRHTVVKHIQNLGYRIGWFISKTDPLACLQNIKRKADVSRRRDPKKWGDGYISLLTDEAKNFMQVSAPFFCFCHVNPDYYGHVHGEASARYEDEIAEADVRFGDIMSALPPDTNTIVITDHGFDKGGYRHKNAPDSWMATNLPIQATTHARTVDVGATLYDWYGIETGTPPERPLLRGISLL